MIGYPEEPAILIPHTDEGMMEGLRFLRTYGSFDLPVVELPVSLAVSPDGRTLYVADAAWINSTRSPRFAYQLDASVLNEVPV